MFFDWPTWLIVAGLLVLMFAMNEGGFRAGRRNRVEESDASRSVSWALKGSILGLVALLLGFSFSATTARYDMSGASRRTFPSGAWERAERESGCDLLDADG
jgi:hypothetical protein